MNNRRGKDIDKKKSFFLKLSKKTGKNNVLNVSFNKNKIYINTKLQMTCKLSIY